METSFWSATILLILITDPLGNIPPVISALKNVAPERRKKIILRECLIAFFTLLLFMLFGRHFLSLLHLTDSSLRVAGGVILLLIAIRMIFPHQGAVPGSEADSREPFIVPIAIPLVAGPSAMATALLLSSREPNRVPEWIGALVITMLASWVVFSLANRLQKALGDQGITALERLMGLVLTAISVEMLLGGITSYLSQVQK